MGANNSKDREPDALERLAMSPFFDFLETGSWDSSLFYFYISIGLITAGLSTAIMARKVKSEKLLTLAKWTWISSLVSFIWTCFTALPRIGKFMTIFTILAVSVPLFLIAATIYIFDAIPETDKKDKVDGGKELEKKNAKVEKDEGKFEVEKASGGPDEAEVSRVEEPEVVEPPIDGS